MPDFNTILTLLGTAGGLAVLYGVWLNRSKVPLEVRVLDLQGEKLAVDAHKVADDYVLQTLIDSRLTIDRLRSERDEWRDRATAAETRIEEFKQEQDKRHKMIDELFVLKVRTGWMEEGMSYAEAFAKRVDPPYHSEEVGKTE